MIAASPPVPREVRLVREFWQRSRPQRLRNVTAWAEAELKLPNGPCAGRQFKVDRLPYARLLLQEMGKWRRHVITGPTQSGKTYHGYIIPIMYYLFEVKEDVICGVPDLSMAGVKWQQDIKPSILASSYANQIMESGPGSRGGRPSQITFRNGRSLLFMAGGGGDKQRAGATAKVLVVTETDEMDVVSESSREGQNKLDQFEGRVRAHGLEARMFFECTVSTEDAFTWREFEAGTASRIACPCPHCGEWVTPEREHLVGWDGADTKMEAGRSAAFSCPECGGLYSEAQRIEMNDRSVLVHRGQEVTASGEVVGEPIETDTLGFRWSAFNNLLMPTLLIGQEEWDVANSDGADQLEREVAISQKTYAIPVKNENVEKTDISVGIVRGSDPKYAGRCCGLARGVVPDGTEHVTAFVDISRRMVQWEVVSWQSNRSHTVDYGVNESPNPDVIGDRQAIMDSLDETVAKIEGRYSLSLGLVDAGHWPDVIRDWVQRHGGSWRASHGMATYSHPKPAKDKRPSRSGAPWHFSLVDGVWVLNFDPDYWKHVVHSSFLLRPLNDDGTHRTGSVTLFGDDPKEHTDYAQSITAEEFVSEFKVGRGMVRTWKKLRKFNHFLDTRTGNTLASAVLVESQKQQAATQPVHPAEQQPQPAFTTPDGRPFLITER